MADTVDITWVKVHAVSRNYFAKQQSSLMENLEAITSTTNGLLSSLDLTDEASMDVARELLKRLAFLQSTIRYLHTIQISTTDKKENGVCSRPCPE